MQANNEIVTGPAQSRPFLVVGLLLGVGSLAVYVIQFSAQVLIVPWYLPIFTTTGCLMFVWALLQHRTWSRMAGLVFMALLSLGAWGFIGYARLPEYEGPVKSAYAFPPFASLTADGEPFTPADLKAPQNTVMVFFRGRW
jgi:fucose 4-O-acetylase-like acetyltransferase